MPDPAREQTVSGYLNSLRENKGWIPLGVLIFDAEKQEFCIALTQDVNKDELNALLEKIKIKFTSKKCTSR